jgi:hypothetical protein
VLPCFTVLFSPCASYILSIDVVYRLPVCNHCITSNVNQACALLGLPREKPWMVPSLFSRPKPKPSQHAVAHCTDYSTCGYSPRFASRETSASWQHHDAAQCRCLLQDSHQLDAAAGTKPSSLSKRSAET